MLAATKPKAPSSLARHARDQVSRGKPTSTLLTPNARHHYQSPPPAITIKYTHMKPIDYIGLYIIVTAASCITVNWLFRIYF